MRLPCNKMPSVAEVDVLAGDGRLHSPTPRASHLFTRFWRMLLSKKWRVHPQICANLSLHNWRVLHTKAMSISDHPPTHRFPNCRRWVAYPVSSISEVCEPPPMLSPVCDPELFALPPVICCPFENVHTRLETTLPFGANPVRCVAPPTTAQMVGVSTLRQNALTNIPNKPQLIPKDVDRREAAQLIAP